MCFWQTLARKEGAPEEEVCKSLPLLCTHPFRPSGCSWPERARPDPASPGKGRWRVNAPQAEQEGHAQQATRATWFSPAAEFRPLSLPYLLPKIPVGASWNLGPVKGWAHKRWQRSRKAYSTQLCESERLKKKKKKLLKPTVGSNPHERGSLIFPFPAVPF